MELFLSVCKVFSRLLRLNKFVLSAGLSSALSGRNKSLTKSFLESGWIQSSWLKHIGKVAARSYIIYLVIYLLTRESVLFAVVMPRNPANLYICIKGLGPGMGEVWGHRAHYFLVGQAKLGQKSPLLQRWLQQSQNCAVSCLLNGQFGPSPRCVM